MYCAFYFFTKNLVISQPYFVAKDLLFSWLLSLACFAVLCKREVGLVSIDTWQHIQQKALAHSQTPVCLCSRQHDEIQMLIKATFSQSQRKLSKCNSLMLPFPLGCMGKRGCEHGDCAAGVSRAEEFPPPSSLWGGQDSWLHTLTSLWQAVHRVCRFSREHCPPPLYTGWMWSTCQNCPSVGLLIISFSCSIQRTGQGSDTPQLHGHPTVGTRKFWEVALYSFHQDKESQTWHFLVTPTGQATTISSWNVFTQPWLYMHLPTESELWCFLEVLEDNGI